MKFLGPSNNYGPYQFPEKLIPLMILNAVEGKALPIYGDGGNVRDWLYVEDHCEGILRVLRQGRLGEKYNIGGGNERTNLQVVDALCAILDEERPTWPRLHRSPDFILDSGVQLVGLSAPSRHSTARQVRVPSRP